MTSIAWMTDIHLNFLGTEAIEAWLESLRQTPFDALIISGDIGEAPSVRDYLLRMQISLNIPIYFVLGNHDYYHSSVAHMQATMRHMARQNPHLHWLSDQKTPISLTPDTALIGHEGWSDGRYGDYEQSSIMLHDYVYIQELANLTKKQRLKRLEALADTGAKHLNHLLPMALADYQHVYVVMHAPPFRETCYYQGQVAQPDNVYLPHFTCKAHGDVLLAHAHAHPDKMMTVLCGHTHGACDVHIRPNLRVLCGGAEYQAPRIQQIIHL